MLLDFHYQLLIKQKSSKINQKKAKVRKYATKQGEDTVKQIPA